MNKTKPEIASRRNFLKAGVAVGGGAAVAALLPGTATAAGEDRTGTGDDKQNGYQLSKHVADYYRAAKI